MIPKTLLQQTPWDIKDESIELGRVAMLLGAAAIFYGAGVTIRHELRPLEVAARTSSYFMGAGFAAYAGYKLWESQRNQPIRESALAITDTIAKEVFAAKAEWYASHYLEAMLGHEPDPAYITASLRRSLGFVPEELEPEHAQATETHAIAPTESSASESTIHYFDWADLANSTDHPHLLILGGSGDGKTTLMEWIGRSLPGELMVWTTKKKGYQWTGLSTVGIPLDVGAISSAYQETILELTSRCKDLDHPHQPMTILWDEISFCVSQDKSLSPATLLMVGREAKIRLIAAPHGGQVGSIGLEGQSDVITCATLIRLGDFAIQYAESLLKKKRLSVAEFQALKDSDRPCMVNDALAIVPDLREGWQLDHAITIKAESTQVHPLIELLSAAQQPMTVRELMRTSPGRKSKLTADQIRQLLRDDPAVTEIEENGVMKFRFLEPVTV